MKIVKNIICCSLILLVIANLILPNLSYADYRTYYEGATGSLAKLLQGEAEDKVRKKISQDQANNDENYTLTKSFLEEMNEYLQEFYEKATIFGDSIENQSTEGLEEFRNCVKNGLGNYFGIDNEADGSNSYVNYLLYKIEEIETEANSQGWMDIKKKDNIIFSANATQTVIREFIGTDREIDESDIEDLVSRLGDRYQEGNEEEQVKKIVEDVKQKIHSLISGYTEGQEEELAKAIEQQVASVENENVSDAVKAQAKAKLEELFYTDGEVDIEKAQRNLGIRLNKPAEENQWQGDYDSDPLGSTILKIIDGALGILLYPFRLLILVPAIVAEAVFNVIASVGGDQLEVITIESVLFNKLKLTDINIFGQANQNGELVSPLLQEIRTNIAKWYYALRNLAIAVSLLALLYIGIRMAISSIAEEKAKYKQMLANWVVGFGLIFILHYFIIAVIKVNTGLVEGLQGNEINGTEFMNQLFATVFTGTFTVSLGAAIMYTMLCVITFIFLMIYIKRMLMICFLTMIVPLISITYGIDKIGNNKSEILNQWLKEFCYNVLIQPFHCIAYIVFAKTAINTMYQGSGFDFGAIILAIICICCIFMGEKLVRTIFGFTKSSSLAQKLFVGGMVTKTISNAQNVARTMQQTEAEEEEQEAPMFMPDGTSTEETVKQQRSEVKLVSKEKLEKSLGKGEKNPKEESKPEKQESKETKTTPKTNTATAMPKKKKTSRTPLIVKDAADAYVNGLKTMSGYNLYQDISYKAKQKKMPKAEELFLLASENYRKSVNPGMTNKQLALQMEAIMKTPTKKLTDSNDIIYKSWIEHTRKQLTAKGNSEAIQTMKDSIEHQGEKRKKRNS